MQNDSEGHISCVLGDTSMGLRSYELNDLPFRDLHRWTAQHGAALVFGSDTVEQTAQPIESAIEQGWRSGLYFLVWRDLVVYVGISTNIAERLRAHLVEGKPIERVAFMCGIPKPLLAGVEHAYANAWRPAWNADVTRECNAYGLDKVRELIARTDKSKVAPYYLPVLRPPVPKLKVWEAAIIGHQQKFGL